MGPGGLSPQLYKAAPYGKRPPLAAKQSDVDAMFAKVNWDVATKHFEVKCAKAAHPAQALGCAGQPPPTASCLSPDGAENLANYDSHEVHAH